MFGEKTEVRSPKRVYSFSGSFQKKSLGTMCLLWLKKRGKVVFESVGFDFAAKRLSSSQKKNTSIWLRKKRGK